ncbi:MAG: PAS domain S-box protein [Rhodospirillaceae bacterium]|nr:PAS domain S-box protein [Rhodospirillales bacterium]
MTKLWPVENPLPLGRDPSGRRDDLQLIIDAMPDGVLVLSTAQIILNVNHAAERLFGFRAGHMLGSSFAALAETACDLAPVPTPREVMGRRSDGSVFPMEVSVTRLALAGELMVVTLRDLTERRRVAAEHSALGEQFFQAQRMEAMGIMARWVAHDIGNILNAMLACTEFVRERLPGGDAAEPVLDSAMRAGMRGRDVVGQLVAFGRNDMVEDGPVCLSHIVRDAAALLPCVERNGLRLVFDQMNNVPAVKGNSAQLYQVVANLFVNAVQAARPEGGELRVGMELITLDEGFLASGGVQRDGGCWHLTVGHLQPGPYVRLRVSDDGIGMAPETLAHIFEPFFSTKRASGQCSGLGLSAVFGIVSQQGGAISVRTCLDQGATFDVLLPAMA